MNNKLMQEFMPDDSFKEFVASNPATGRTLQLSALLELRATVEIFFW